MQGQNLEIEYRSTENEAEFLPQLVAELVAQKSVSGASDIGGVPVNVLAMFYQALCVWRRDSGRGVVMG